MLLGLLPSTPTLCKAPKAACFPPRRRACSQEGGRGFQLSLPVVGDDDRPQARSDATAAGPGEGIKSCADVGRGSQPAC